MCTVHAFVWIAATGILESPSAVHTTTIARAAAVQTAGVAVGVSCAVHADVGVVAAGVLRLPGSGEAGPVVSTASIQPAGVAAGAVGVVYADVGVVGSEDDPDCNIVVNPVPDADEDGVEEWEDCDDNDPNIGAAPEGEDCPS